jgi:hypothetical protein
MSTLEVNSIQPLSSGTTVTLGASGKTFTIPSGCTITNSGTATGFGKIGQIVSVKSTAAVNTSSTSFVAVSEMTLNITPTATSSKIYLTNMQLMSFSNSGGYWSHVTIYRNGSNLSPNSDGLGTMRTNTGDNFLMTNIIYMDEPSSTSQQTYQVYIRSPNSITVNYNQLGAGASLVAMEILA